MVGFAGLLGGTAIVPQHSAGAAGEHLGIGEIVISRSVDYHKARSAGGIAGGLET